jgi:hypothetical protein
MAHLLKFRSGSKYDLDALHNSYMWFDAINNQNDAFEGKYKLVNKEILPAKKYELILELHNRLRSEYGNSDFIEKCRYILTLYQSSSTEFNKKSQILIEDLSNFLLDNSNKKNYIFSGSVRTKDNILKNETDPLTNHLLWGHYANGFKGFCIEWDLTILNDSLKKQGISGEKINYTSTNPTFENVFKNYASNYNHFKDDDYYLPLFYKSKHWSYEEEYRFVSKKIGKIIYPKDSIVAIYTFEKTPIWLKHYISRTIQDIYPNAKHIEGHINDDNSELIF